MEWLRNVFSSDCRHKCWNTVKNLARNIQQTFLYGVSKHHATTRSSDGSSNRINQVFTNLRVTMNQNYWHVIYLVDKCYSTVVEVIDYHYYSGIATLIPMMMHGMLYGVASVSMPSLITLVLHGPWMLLITNEHDAQHLCMMIISMFCFVLYRNPYYLIYIYFIYYMVQITNPSNDVNKLCFVNYIIYVCVVEYMHMLNDDTGGMTNYRIGMETVEGVYLVLSFLTMYGCFITKTKTTLDVYINNVILLQTFLFNNEWYFTLYGYNAIYLAYWARLIYHHVFCNHDGIMMISMASMLVLATMINTMSYSIHVSLLLLVCIAELVATILEFEATIFQPTHVTSIDYHDVALMSSINHYRMMLWGLIINTMTTDSYTSLLVLFLSALVQMMKYCVIGYWHSRKFVINSVMYSLLMLYSFDYTNVDGGAGGFNISTSSNTSSNSSTSSNTSTWTALQSSMVVTYCTLCLCEYFVTLSHVPAVIEMMYGIATGFAYRRLATVSTSVVSSVLNFYFAAITPFIIDDVCAIALMILCGLDTENVIEFLLPEQWTFHYIGSCTMFVMAMIRLLYRTSRPAGQAGVTLLMYLYTFIYFGILDTLGNLEQGISHMKFSLYWNDNAWPFVDQHPGYRWNTWVSDANISDYIVMTATVVFIVLIASTRNI